MVHLIFFVDYSLLWCHDQFFHPCTDVHLLRAVRTRTTHAEVPVVEEVFNPRPTGKYHVHEGAQTHIS